MTIPAIAPADSLRTNYIQNIYQLLQQNDIS